MEQLERSALIRLLSVWPHNRTLHKKLTWNKHIALKLNRWNEHMGCVFFFLHSSKSFGHNCYQDSLFIHCCSWILSRLCILVAYKYVCNNPLYMQDKVNWFLLADSPAAFAFTSLQCRWLWNWHSGVCYWCLCLINVVLEKKKEKTKGIWCSPSLTQWDCGGLFIY